MTVNSAVHVVLIPIVLFAVAPRPTLGQSAAAETFLSEAALASHRFEDPAAAIADGYRKLGPDFPGMGEHWVSPGLVIGGILDPARPSVLCYALIAGERVLVGLAFTRVLSHGETPPEEPLPREAWHDHTGGVDAESLLLSGPASAHTGGGGFRLSMIHLWTPIENRVGPFAQNNWALPFLRAGLTLPQDTPSSEAARALSLAGDGVEFYRRLLRQGLELEGHELERAEVVFAQAAERVEIWKTGLGLRSSPEPQDILQLEEIWALLWDELRSELSAPTFQRVQVLDPSG